MASCKTGQWVSYAPYVKLTVTTYSSTDTSTKLKWVLEYIASSAANTSSARAYTVKINGAVVKDSTYSIDGKTGTKTIASGYYDVAKGTSAKSVSFSVSFDFKLTWSGSYAGTKSASGSISIPAKTKYTVSYNANGGSGAPSAQTKWHGTTLTLSSTKPTRSGYTFVGWGTSTSSTSGYSAGGSYTANASDTLYAIWKKTITLSFNANGGSGAPSSQSATVYNATTSNTFTISSTKPTRTGYTFQGWATSAGGSVAYSAGGSVTLSANTTLYAVWKINTWTVSYNANGGTNAPSAQTKTYGTDLKLSTSKPSRSGYNFKGWATSATGSVAYQPGDVYSSNSAITLHAVWERAIFTVTYNANGGNNAPASQEKIYGTDLTLVGEPTRKYHTFKGWATSANGSVVYSAGGTYTANADITLYAVWEVAYLIPRITSVSVTRCDADGNPLDDGTYALVQFNWASDEDVLLVTIYWKTSTETAYGNSQSVASTGRSGSVSEVVGGGTLTEDVAYNFKIEVVDTTDHNSATQTLSATLFPIDLLAGGKGVSIGEPAKEEGFKVNMESEFKQPVWAMGGIMNPVLEEGTDLNDVMVPNVYTSFPASDNAYANCPFTDGTFVLEVYSSGPEEQVYQRISTCNKDDPDTYVRFYYGDSWGDWICANGDFIIERGSHDFWVYRKYASGDAECWGIYWKPAADYKSPAVDTGWYFDGDSTKVSFPPNLFSTGPYSIIAQPIYAHASTHFGISWADKNEICGWVNVVRQETNVTIGISFHVKGWWK